MKLFKKKYYWYTVSFHYRDNKSQTLFDWTRQLGVTTKSDVLKLRELKQTQSHVFNNENAKPLLCNGTLSATVLAYLGKFSKQE